jgi:hypothetical protein
VKPDAAAGHDGIPPRVLPALTGIIVTSPEQILRAGGQPRRPGP